jgi:sigma-B regulation protein RsbU (phosphoserine phosphatase)
MDQRDAKPANHYFSPLQIGSIVEVIPPVAIGSSVAETLAALKEEPDRRLIPVEQNGKVVGLVLRNLLEKLSGTASLEACMIPALGTVDASAYISTVMKTFLGGSRRDEAPWFVAQHNQSYMGLAGLHKIIERSNSLQVRDLVLAGEIQQNLLDKSRVNDKRLRVLLYNKMAHELGGDFYRVFKSGKDRYLIGCFDVAGKNISGSLATMALGACFSALELFKFEGGAEKTTQFINSLVREVNPPGVFVAAVLFYIDFTTMTVKIHNCGFSPVLIFVPRRDNKITLKTIQPSLPPLGIQEELDVDAGQIVPIAAGLRLAAYSDGLTDMTNISGERYGEEKTNELLKKLHRIQQGHIRQNLESEIAAWTGEASLADDVTLVDMRFVQEPKGLL